MAGDVPGLNITVTLDTSGVKAGADKATTSVKNIAAEAEKASSKFTGLKTVMLGTFASSELQKGVKDLEGFIKESISVAEEAQTSIAGLGTAMNDAKINTEANRQVVDKVTESMANLGFTGNSTREALTKMVTATGSMSQAQKMMGVAADYARIKHMDLNTATTVLTRATAGQMRAFAQYGITLDSTLPKNQAITKAFGELNAKIGGQAAAYAETYAGKLAILSVKTNDLKEKVGTLLLPVLTKLSSWFIDSLDFITKHKVLMEGLALLFASVLVPVLWNMAAALSVVVADWIALNWPIMAVVAAIAAVAAGFIWAWNKFDVFRHAVVTGIEAVLDIVAFLIRAVGVIAEAFLQVVTGPMRLMLKALGFFVPAAKTASDEIGKMPKAVGDFFDGAANKVESFKKTVEKVKDTKIKIALPDFAKELATAGGKAGADPNIEGTTHDKISKAASKAEAKRQADLKKALDNLTKLQKDYDAALKERQDKMDTAMADKLDRDTKAQDAFNTKITDLQTKHDDAMQSAQENFDQASLDAHQAYTDKMTQIDADFASKQADLLASYNDKVAQLEQQAADKSIQLQQAAVDKKQSIVQQSIDLLTSAWANATKIDIGSLFTNGGQSSLLSTTVVNGIVTSVYGAATGTADALKVSLQEKLKEIQQLQQDAGKLAAAGYSQSFIQEVLAQGPTVGDQLAQSVLNAAPDTQGSIKSLYNQIQDTSQNGLDALATQMNSGAQLATQKLMDQYAQVDVALQKDLAQNAASLQTALDIENKTYTEALAKASEAHTKAAADAQQALDKALSNAQDALTAAQNKANKALSDGTAAAQDILTKALADSQSAYDKSIKAISASTDKQLSALMTKIGATAAAIKGLGGIVPVDPAVNMGFGALADSQSAYDKSINAISGSTTLSSGAISNPGGAFTPSSNAPQINLSQVFNSTGTPDPAAVGQAATRIIKFGQSL